jgi:trehalose 2-sulfotransferase
MNDRPVRSYLVCATPRSGSTLLCEVLGSTELAGHPAEYFLRKDYAHWCREWDVRGFDAFLDRALAAGTTPNGVFGAKVMWGYFDDMVARLAAARRMRVVSPSLHRGRTPLSPTHRRTFPRLLVSRTRALRCPRISADELLQNTFPDLTYVHITRRDKVRQAISRWKLRQTKVATVRSDKNAALAAAPVRFSYMAIDRLVREARAHEAAWEAFYAEAGVTPIRVIYEELAADPSGSVHAVLMRLGVSVPNADIPISVQLRRQSDDISEHWYELYHSRRARRKRIIRQH